MCVKKFICITCATLVMFSLTGCKDEEEQSGNLVDYGIVDDVTGKFVTETDESADTPSKKNDISIKEYIGTLNTEEDCENFRQTWIDSCSYCYQVGNNIPLNLDGRRFEFNPKNESEIPTELGVCDIYGGLEDIHNIDAYNNVNMVIENGMVYLTLDGLTVFPTNYDCDNINKLMAKRVQTLK